MGEATGELKMPAAIYDRVEAIANDSGRSAESVIVNGLSLLFGELTGLDLEPEALQALGCAGGPRLPRGVGRLLMGCAAQAGD